MRNIVIWLLVLLTLGLTAAAFVTQPPASAPLQMRAVVTVDGDKATVVITRPGGKVKTYRAKVVRDHGREPSEVGSEDELSGDLYDLVENLVCHTTHGLLSHVEDSDEIDHK